jgi:ABC-type spermidine/putrescine transport system permease subunit II
MFSNFGEPMQAAALNSLVIAFWVATLSLVLGVATARGIARAPSLTWSAPSM